MHTSPSEPSQDRISDEAAQWCMRLHEPDFSDPERQQLERWLKADAEHQREFDAMLEIWTISEFLSTDVAASAPGAIAPPAAAPTQPPAARRRRGRRPLMAAAALVLGLPIIGWLGWEQGLIPDDYQRYEAQAGIQEVRLPDGSHVQLNLGTRLSYANYKDRRSVSLKQGEAYFEVSHDAAHPFTVDAGKGQIRVTGTRFNVWNYQDQVVVTLTEGSVQVRSDRNSAELPAYLSPGMQARFDASHLAPEVSAASPADALAWRNGKLILRDLTLNEALPQLNRYLPVPVHLGDQATGQLRVGGVFNTRDIAGLVQNLPKVLPVYLSRNDDGETVIRRQ